MTIYDAMKARIDIERKCDSLRKSYEEANDKVRTYYNEHLLPAEEDPTVSDEEMDAIYDTYDNLCDAFTWFDEQIEIAERAIDALLEVESALAIAESEGIWKEG